MNIPHVSVSGPFTHENLAVFLLRGTEAFDGGRYASLDEALEQKSVIVYETGNVGQLEIENLSDQHDVFVQAGDVVKGGRQDRTLGVDFVVPARSGRVPVPTFCVESGRWHQRGDEQAASFSSSKSYLSSKKLRLASKLARSQGAVWKEVAKTQEDLSASLDAAVHSAESPTSYQLTVENEALQRRKALGVAALQPIVDGFPDAVGYAFAINGVINTADVYGSAKLFRKLWSKLLDAVVLEAIAESRRAPVNAARSVDVPAIERWLFAADSSVIADQQDVPPRVTMDTRHFDGSVLFDTRDRGLENAVIHRNVVTRV